MARSLRRRAVRLSSLTRRQALSLLGGGTAASVLTSCGPSEPDPRPSGGPSLADTAVNPLHYMSLRDVATSHRSTGALAFRVDRDHGDG